MVELDELFDDILVQWTDMQGHIPYLVELAEQSEKIIELGNRGGISTIAFLYGMQGRGHLWSVDIDVAPPMTFPHWTFIHGDDRSQRVQDLLPHDVDVLLIDTSHAYEHTLQKLDLYADRVKPGGHILLHDTEVEYPDGIGPSIAYPVKEALGVWCAKRNLSWENHPHSFGLGVVTL